jgi:RHS repeat-associated protein
MKNVRGIRLSLALLFLVSIHAAAQAPAGVFADANSPSGPPDPTKLDLIWNVDNLTGALTVKIPFPTVPTGGRGPVIPFSLLYNSASTVNLQESGQVYVPGLFTPATITDYVWATPGTSGDTSVPAGPWTSSGPKIVNSMTTVPSQEVNGQITYYGCGVYGPYIYTDVNGNSHDMNLEHINPAGHPVEGTCATQEQTNETTTDGSALLTFRGGPAQVIHPDGTSVNDTTLEDTNGNTATLEETNGNTALVATDGVGRTAFSTTWPMHLGGPVPAGTYTFTTYDSSGESEPYTITVAKESIGTFTMPRPAGPSDYPGLAPSLTNVGQPVSGEQLSFITSIELPNQTSYVFTPDPTYGTIAKIQFPTGGYVRFVYGVRDDGGGYGYFTARSTITVTDVYLSSGSGTESHWHYGFTPAISTSGFTDIVTAPDGTTTDYAGSSWSPFTKTSFAFGRAPSWLETERLVKDSAGNLTQSIATAYNSGIAVPSQITTTYYGTTPLQQQVHIQYDSYNNAIEKDESAFYTCSGSPCPTASTPPAGWLRTTFTTYQYQNNSTWVTANIVNKPSQILVTDGNSHPYSLVQYGYDQMAVGGLAGYSNHDDKNYGLSSTLPRGNLTSESRCATLATSMTVTPATAASACSQWSTTVHTYDLAGQMLSTKDPNGNLTSFSYVDDYAEGTPSSPTDGYVTTVTHPGGFTDTYSYDYSSGQMATHRDWNKQTTQYSYTDPINRLTEVAYPDGGSVQIDYNIGTTPPKITTTTATGEADGAMIRTTQYDGLGRVSQNQLASDRQGADLVDTTYDSLGRVASVSNPHRAGAAQPSDGITSYAYDALSRRVLQCNQDNGTTGACAAGSSYRQWDYTSFPTIDIYDELRNHSQQTVDALGRLIIVKEPDSTNTPTFETDYAYDALSNLINVNQKGKSGTDMPRVRMFTYDGLSRLVQAFNPETGWICYGTTGGIGANGGNCTSGYDANGNLGAKTDARGFTTTYQYDNLNRMTFESSNAPNTLTHSWVYDLASVAGITTINPAGRLVFTGAYFSGPPIANESGTMYWNHDPMGRVLGTKICTPTTCSNTNANDSGWYDLANTYDLAGNMASYTDGFGTTISSTYDAANRLLRVTSSKNDLTHPGTLWTANTYSAVGLTQATLGNGVVDTRQYTNRTWLQSLNAKTATGPVIYSEALTYYPNGNPQAVTDPVNGNWTYTYDQTNRILTGISTNTGQGCQFTYDPFGNRKTSAPDQGTCTSPTFTFTASTTNHIDGYCYDGAGNLNDPGPCPPSGSNHLYFYDGYNHLLSPNFNQTGRAGYVVDAFGHRVGKSLNGTWARIYLYGLDGNPVAEMDGTGAWQQTNVHVGGQFLAEYQGTDTDFQHGDHLGTIRAQSNSAGTRITTCSNLPFGDSLNCNGNTNPSGYHFTGKERDTESGLDHFGARYYASAMGRMLSPDPFLPLNQKPEQFQAWIANPQHWNKYAYVLNNPLKYTDPTGMTETIYYFLSKNATDAQRKFFSDHKDAILGAIGAKLKEAGIKDVVFKDGASLSAEQVSNILENKPTGVGLLNFTNKSFGGYNAPSGNYGATAEDGRSAVFVGNLQVGQYDGDALAFRVSEVGSHELGHRMGFFSRGAMESFMEFWNHDLMNEGQGVPTSPEHFDMSIPQNQKIVDQINQTPEYNPN